MPWGSPLAAVRESLFHTCSIHAEILWNERILR